MRYTNIVLTLIAVLLATLAWDRAMRPAPTAAQSADRDLYIEPGQTMLRKIDGTATVIGKVVINRRTGDIWGFPTGNDSPYPITPTKKGTSSLQADVPGPVRLQRNRGAA